MILFEFDFGVKQWALKAVIYCLGFLGKVRLRRCFYFSFLLFCSMWRSVWLLDRSELFYFQYHYDFGCNLTSCSTKISQHHQLFSFLNISVVTGEYFNMLSVFLCDKHQIKAQLWDIVFKPIEILKVRHPLFFIFVCLLFKSLCVGKHVQVWNFEDQAGRHVAVICLCQQQKKELHIQLVGLFCMI